MFSTRPNQNNVAVTEAFLANIADNAEKYRCIPLCADTRKLRNGDHKHLGHMLDKQTGMFLTEQIGAFACFEKVNDEYGASLIGEARIAKRNKKVCQAILDLYESGNLNFSFEIIAGELTEQDGVTIIGDSESNELIGMAVVSLPAYPEAKALALVAEIDEDNRQQAMLKHARMEISEVDFWTIRHWFYEALKAIIGESIWDYSFERVGVDSAILYNTMSGITIKVEYVAGDEGVLITDAYEVVYQRKEQGGDGQMTGTVKDQAVQARQPAAAAREPLKNVQEPQSPAGVIGQIVPPVDAWKETEIAGLKAENESLKAQLTEFPALKAEVETLRAEKEEAAKQARREQLTRFAEAQKLDMASEVVQAAIAAGDYETLVAETMKQAAPAKPAAAAVAISASIQQTPYGGLLDSDGQEQ